MSGGGGEATPDHLPGPAEAAGWVEAAGLADTTGWAEVTGLAATCATPADDTLDARTRLATDARLTRLWRAAHRRLEAAGAEASDATVHLDDLDPDERLAVDRLLGTRSRGRSVRIPVAQLDRLLRDRAGTSLVDLVSDVVGPVVDRPAARRAAADEETAMWARLFGHPAVEHRPALVPWLERTRALGTWRRLPAPGTTLGHALDVLAVLPQAVPVGRSRLAGQVLQDAHGLDDDRPIGKLVVAALAHESGISPPLRAADRRRLWAAEGVVIDDTSSRVLTLGLRPLVTGPLTEAAGRWADGNVPLHLPLAAVQSETWALPAGTRVWVCENPAVLAGAAGTGRAASPTMVCLEGRPSLAVTELLGQLAGHGAELAYHGDFGSGGIGIANGVIGALDARPWRFGADDHAQALERARRQGAHGQLGMRPLRGPVPDACWDAALSPAIRSCGVEIEEELVIDLLLADLEAAG